MKRYQNNCNRSRQFFTHHNKHSKSVQTLDTVMNHNTETVWSVLAESLLAFLRYIFCLQCCSLGATITYWIIWLSHQSPRAVTGLHLPKHLSDHPLINGLMNCTVLWLWSNHNCICLQWRLSLVPLCLRVSESFPGKWLYAQTTQPCLTGGQNYQLQLWKMYQDYFNIQSITRNNKSRAAVLQHQHTNMRMFNRSVYHVHLVNLEDEHAHFPN